MDEVNVNPVDIRLELIERVQALLLGSPVVLFTPIFDKALQVSQVGAVVPSCIRKLVRETALGQPPFQIGQDGVRNLNFERDDRLARSSCIFRGALCVRDPARREKSDHTHSGRNKSNVIHSRHTVRTYTGAQAESAAPKYGYTRSVRSSRSGFRPN